MEKFKVTQIRTQKNSVGQWFYELWGTTPYTSGIVFLGSSEKPYDSGRLAKAAGYAHIAEFPETYEQQNETPTTPAPQAPPQTETKNH